MKNILSINQPLAVDAEYLQSLIPSLIMGFYQKDFLTSREIEENLCSRIENQEAQATQRGESQFPVVVNIIGPIIKYSSWYYVGTQFLAEIVKSLDQDSKVSSIVFNIDSGGGMVSGTREFCDIISQCTTTTIAYTNGYMCSAAYEIASACDKRIAHPAADLIGSIGTMMSYQDYSAMFEKWGAMKYELYAPQSSEKNIEFRQLKEGNQKLYESKLERITADFIGFVKSNLGESLQDDGHVFKGKTYSPQEALEIGLVDGLATMDELLIEL